MVFLSNDEIVIEKFLRIKRLVQGDDAADRTEFSLIGNNVYQVYLPLKDDILDCGHIHIDVIEQMAVDLINNAGI